jgi:hypothetical protein
MYEELAELRQSMNAAPHVEPDGSEVFPDGDQAPRPRRPVAPSAPAATQG